MATPGKGGVAHPLRLDWLWHRSCQAIVSFLMWLSSLAFGNCRNQAFTLTTRLLMGTRFWADISGSGLGYLPLACQMDPGDW